MEVRTKNRLQYAERFWGKVDIKIGGCWEWKGATQSKGYGSVARGDGTTALAHRIAYELVYGKIPKGLCVLHNCDNRKCVNLNHLFLGTIQDNNRDKCAKNRQSKGENSGRSKLKVEDVLHIRRLHNNEGYSIAKLARQFNISSSHISDITKEKYWKLPLAE